MRRAKNLVGLLMALIILKTPTLASASANSCSSLFESTGFLGAELVGMNAGGSTGGRWYRDSTDRKWFIKKDVHHNELQTSAEVIGTLIYRHFGYQTPEIKKMIVGGVHYSASADIGVETIRTRFDGMNTGSFRRMRVVAAFLADYDRIGNADNNRLLPDGSVVLIDFGGALGAQPRGQHKEGQIFSNAIGSFPSNANIFEIMGSAPLRYFGKSRFFGRLITKPLPYDHPWRQLSSQDASVVIEQFRQLTDEKIASIVVVAGYSQKADRDYMIHALQQRRDTIIKDLNEKYVPLMVHGEVNLERL